MRKVLILAVVIAAVGSIGKALQDPQVRVEVEAVNVLVTVVDSSGRFLTDLTIDDFIVYEDGRVQTLTNFSQDTDLPLRIGMLVDTSSSVRMKLDFEKEAAINFVNEVMRPRDRALLAVFDNGVTLLQDLTPRPDLLTQRISRLQAGGGTALLDAIYTVARDKMVGDDLQKTIVLLSDGRDRDSEVTLNEAIDMAQKSEVTVFSIGTSRFGASGSKDGDDMLERLAEQTGGEAFFPHSSDLLQEAFNQVNEELRSRYSVTYVPINRTMDGKFRKIKVNVRGPKGMRVRHKAGYFASATGT